MRKQDFFDSAAELLSKAEELKLGSLCKHAGVTTGAFYYHFESLRDFRRQLLQHWVWLNKESLARARGSSDPEVRLEEFVLMAVRLPHRMESAIRMWAQSDDDARSALNIVDRTRWGVAEEEFRPYVGRVESSNLAWRALYTLVGHQQLDCVPGARMLEGELRRLVREVTGIRRRALAM